MRSFLLSIEYNGSCFSGLQLQGAARTVEYVFRSAISKFLIGNWHLIFSSRTDSGVHATGQTAMLQTDNYVMATHDIMRALNAFLPSDVRVVSIVSVAPEFHPRGAARLREYHYFFTNDNCPVFFSQFVSKFTYDSSFSFDSVAALFLGEHDFSAFKTSGGSHKTPIKFVAVSKVVDFEIDIGISGSRFIGKKYVIVADSFLYRMVRNIVGAILDCAFGKLTPSQVQQMLESGVRSNPFRTAPSKGLVLKKVYY